MTGAPIFGRQTPYFFFHIPKTGGTSVIASAVSSMGSGQLFYFIDVDEERVQKRLWRMVTINNPFRILTGHVSPTHVPTDIPVKRAIMLRSPLQRLTSNFCWFYEHRNWGRHGEKFFSMPTRLGRSQFNGTDLIEWMEMFGWDNLQTRMIAGHAGIMSGTARRSVSLEDVEICIKQLNTMDLVGVTENMEAFLDQLGTDVWGRPFEARKENQSDGSALQLTELEAREIEKRYLASDLSVYDYAQALAARSPLTKSVSVTGLDRPSRITRWLQPYLYRSPREYARLSRRGATIVIRTIRERFRHWLLQWRP